VRKLPVYLQLSSGHVKSVDIASASHHSTKQSETFSRRVRALDNGVEDQMQVDFNPKA
jgi:hypothetical protein